jgi:hypothetical protein
MHEYLKQSREGAAKKLKGIQSGEPHTKVDSSSWSPPEMLEADKQNGMRPVSKRQYKSGGKVHGEHAKKRADRKARKEGGRAMSVDGFINRDDKMANDERAGVKKVGGMKRGGKIKREHHADGDVVGNMIRQDQIEQGMKGRGLPMRVPMPMPRPADKPVKYTGPKPTTNPNTGYKKGGAAHPDVKEDKALIRKMVKPSARTGKAEGGEKNENIKLKKMPSGAQQYTRGDTHYDRAELLNNMGYNQAQKVYESDTRNDQAAKARDMIWNNAYDDERADWDKDVNEGRYGQKRGGRTKREEHCWGGETKAKKAAGGEAGRGLYVRKGYPHEVPGADGGRTAKKGGGSLGKKKGTTNIHVNVMPHGGSGQPPVMPLPIPVPPRPPMAPPMPPQGMPMGAPPMGGAPEMPPMGAGRPGMPPMGRKHGGKIPAGMKTMHVIDNAAGGGLGRLEKIKEYGLK